MFPFRTLSDRSIFQKVRDVLEAANELREWDETQPQFASPFGLHVSITFEECAAVLSKKLDKYRKDVISLELECEALARRSYQVSEMDARQLDEFANYQPAIEMPIDDISDISDTKRYLVQSVVSFAVGVAFGRWNVRQVLHESRKLPYYHPLAPLPQYPPAFLVDYGDSRSDYPCQVQWDGILVADSESVDDLSGRVRSVFETIWRENIDKMEYEVCKVLAIQDISEYFRKPGRGGFWDDHITRYTKSRRKAPIYWLLQSRSKRISIWLYYHRLDGDTIYKVLRPAGPLQTRITLEESKLDELRKHKHQTGNSSKEAKQLAKDVEIQEEVVSELRDFEDKLRRVADLTLKPELNDGVVLNIAPLHELVPWKEAKKYWDELLAGEYEWSSIGKQLRAKGLVK